MKTRIARYSQDGARYIDVQYFHHKDGLHEVWQHHRTYPSHQSHLAEDEELSLSTYENYYEYLKATGQLDEN